MSSGKRLCQNLEVCWRPNGVQRAANLVIFVARHDQRRPPLVLAWTAEPSWGSCLIGSLGDLFTDWWLSHPSEKYEFVTWDDDIPNWMEKIKKCSKPPIRIAFMPTVKTKKMLLQFFPSSAASAAASAAVSSAAAAWDTAPVCFRLWLEGLSVAFAFTSVFVRLCFRGCGLYLCLRDLSGAPHCHRGWASSGCQQKRPQCVVAGCPSVGHTIPLLSHILSHIVTCSSLSIIYMRTTYLDFSAQSAPS